LLSFAGYNLTCSTSATTNTSLHLQSTACSYNAPAADSQTSEQDRCFSYCLNTAQTRCTRHTPDTHTYTNTHMAHAIPSHTSLALSVSPSLSFSPFLFLFLKF